RGLLCPGAAVADGRGEACADAAALGNAGVGRGLGRGEGRSGAGADGGRGGGVAAALGSGEGLGLEVLGRGIGLGRGITWAGRRRRPSPVPSGAGAGPGRTGPSPGRLSFDSPGGPSREITTSATYPAMSAPSVQQMRESTRPRRPLGSTKTGVRPAALPTFVVSLPGARPLRATGAMFVT
ncbi:MAG: hypothetical protein ABR614_03620, partial [Mycobacteriales bacterium]